jgi:hypothetical protein
MWFQKRKYQYAGGSDKHKQNSKTQEFIHALKLDNCPEFLILKYIYGIINVKAPLAYIHSFIWLFSTALQSIGSFSVICSKIKGGAEIAIAHHHTSGSDHEGFGYYRQL